MRVVRTKSKNFGRGGLMLMVTVTNTVAAALLWVGFFCICLLFLQSVSVDM